MNAIGSVSVEALNLPMTEPFGIAGGAQTQADNVLIRLRMKDGTEGFGEGAPFPAFDGQTQKKTLAAARRAAKRWVGKSADAWQARSAELDAEIPESACARAALESALMDAWCRKRRIPLRLFFGGAETRLATDVTIPIVGAEEAAAAAKRIRAMGVAVLKIKIGSDPAEDAERVEAAARAYPKAPLLLDANGGTSASEALRLLARLKRKRVKIAAFEQPVPKNDLAGLRAVARSGVPVAADESAASLNDILRLAEAKAVSIVNIKLMKFGLIGAWRAALTARAAGLRLMIGGLVETRLAMATAAHLACGLGGFEFFDLDTPLFLAKDPMRGVPIGHGGVYDLAPVKSGIGVVPRT